MLLAFSVDRPFVRSLALLVSLLQLALAGCSGPSSSTDGGPSDGDGGLVAPRPPAPWADPATSPALSGLPRLDGGAPVLLALPAGVGGGLGLALVLEDRDTPVTRRGDCLGRVVACFATNPGPIAGCVNLIEVCPSAEGGRGCCPRGCIEAFNRAIAAGRTESAALEESFVAGTCVPGFVDAVSGVSP